MTRWQGTTIGIGLAPLAIPTARTAASPPALAPAAGGLHFITTESVLLPPAFPAFAAHLKPLLVGFSPVCVCVYV